MKKYFVVSDTHSFYTPLIKELTKKHFDINNDNHILVLLGDLFDRGDETIELYNFINSIPLNRRILIKGNHEDLFLKCLDEREFYGHDFSNGTFKTINAFIDIDLIKNKYIKQPDINAFQLYVEDRDEYFNRVENLEVVKWLKSNEWLDYYETKRHIFTHAFIPVDSINNNYKYNHLWRNSSKYEWEKARWYCPYKMLDNNCYKEKKQLICGHWHCQDFYNHYKHKELNTLRDYKKYAKPFKTSKIIAIDACTAITNKINVLTFKENKF